MINPWISKEQGEIELSRAFELIESPRLLLSWLKAQSEDRVFENWHDVVTSFLIAYEVNGGPTYIGSWPGELRIHFASELDEKEVPEWCWAVARKTIQPMDDKAENNMSVSSAISIIEREMPEGKESSDGDHRTS